MIPRAWTRFSNLISFSFNFSVALRCILIFLSLLLMLDTYDLARGIESYDKIAQYVQFGLS